MTHAGDRGPVPRTPRSTVRRHLALVLTLLLVLPVASCSPRVRAVQTVPDALPFIADGRTSRSEIRGVFGLPSRSFESDRIVTYRLRRDGDAFKAAPRYEEPDAPYELVLVFDARHIVVRHSLVQLW